MKRTIDIEGQDYLLSKKSHVESNKIFEGVVGTASVPVDEEYVVASTSDVTSIDPIIVSNGNVNVNNNDINGNNNDNSADINTTKSKQKRAGFRKIWKELGAAGDKEALDKLAARRETDRVSRRKSRLLLKQKGTNGDKDAQEILARTRVSDTEAHRNRRAVLRVNAATGDVEAIDKLKRSKDVDIKAHKKHREKKLNAKLLLQETMTINGCVEPQGEGAVTGAGSGSGLVPVGTVAVPRVTPTSVTAKPKRNPKSPRVPTSTSTSVAVTETYVDVEAEAISALESLHNAHSGLNMNMGNSIDI